MSSIEVKTFDNPDESNTSFNNAKMDIVKIGDQRVMRLTLQPGCKTNLITLWSPIFTISILALLKLVLLSSGLSKVLTSIELIPFSFYN